MCESSTLTFFVNGKMVSDKNVDPDWTLLYYLRNKLFLFGAKLACAEGGCGSCTVMISKYDRNEDKIDHHSVVACLVPICSVHGLAVTTIEGIGSTRTQLHALQKQFSESYGSLCGYCAPGTIMSMYALLRNSDKPTMEDFEIALQGNICRCTGYRSVQECFQSFLSGTDTCNLKQNCCRANQQSSNLATCHVPDDPTQEPIFPPELKLNDKYDKEKLYFKNKQSIWYRPATMEEVLDLKWKHPEAKCIVGNSEIGIYKKFANIQYPILMHIAKIPELIKVEVTDKGIKFGASVTLVSMERVLKEQIETLPESKTRIFRGFVKIIPWFANKQIRNVASIAGNLINCAPISDLNSTLAATNVLLEIRNKESTRFVEMDENFFTGYLQNILQENEILVSILIPFTNENQFFCAFKQARRKTSDMSIVNSAIFVKVTPGEGKVEDIKIIYGGVSNCTVSAKNTANALKGMPWDKELLDRSFKNLLDDFPLQPDAPGGMITYRKLLILSFFYKAFLTISQKISCSIVDKREISGSTSFELKPFLKNNASLKSDENNFSESNKESCGEAIFIDDLPLLKNELHLVLVKSTKPFAKITSVNAESALNLEGIVAFLSAKDLELNIVNDEEIFASNNVYSEGQIIGAILGKDRLVAEQAAKAVVIDYDDMQPVILTIEDAIKHNSFFSCKPLVKEGGNVSDALSKAIHVVDGECRTGGQDHFYSETQSVLVIPKEDTFEVYSSCENPSYISRKIAEIFKVPENRIVTKVQRTGGGFGGKRTKSLSVALPAAIAARKLNVPVRCCLDRWEDLVMTGGKHPCLMKYKVGFNDCGKILAYEVDLYINTGRSLDLTLDVVENAMSNMRNAYNIANFRIKAYICKTNLPPNTAFIGSGESQVMFCIENVIRHVADYLKRDVINITNINMWTENDTIDNMPLKNSTLQKCWEECLNTSDFHKRRMEVDKYNNENKWKKKGLSIVPVMSGLSYPKNLKEIVVSTIVHSDGSVSVAHCVSESGHKLTTKFKQIASGIFKIPAENIRICETSTCHSVTEVIDVELLIPALLRSCSKIKEKLQKYKNGNDCWESLVSSALSNGEVLLATGCYEIPSLDSGTTFYDYVYGVSCAEVEIDSLTGDHQVLRADVVLDTGESINEDLDKVNISGGFIQGYGYFCMEEVVYFSRGNLYSTGPGMYKLPAITDIPLQFNISLLKNNSMPKPVLGPSIFLGSSILFAIKDAVSSARQESGVNTPFIIDAPATVEKTRINCIDFITEQIPPMNQGDFIPWSVIL